MLYFSIEQKHIITQCNYNYSPEGIYHPDRVMKEYDFLLLINGSWEIVEEDQTYLLHEGDLLILEPTSPQFQTFINSKSRLRFVTMTPAEEIAASLGSPSVRTAAERM